jgi:hypothetical protein
MRVVKCKRSHWKEIKSQLPAAERLLVDYCARLLVDYMDGAKHNMIHESEQATIARTPLHQRFHACLPVEYHNAGIQVADVIAWQHPTGKSRLTIEALEKLRGVPNVNSRLLDLLMPIAKNVTGYLDVLAGCLEKYAKRDGGLISKEEVVRYYEFETPAWIDAGVSNLCLMYQEYLTDELYDLMAQGAIPGLKDAYRLGLIIEFARAEAINKAPMAFAWQSSKVLESAMGRRYVIFRDQEAHIVEHSVLP